MIRRLRHQTKDSTLAFYVNQLENLDKRLYEPLTSVTWGRDVKLRSGITMSNQSTSFIRSSFALPGSLANSSGSTGGNMPWISAETNDIPGISINGEKVVLPLRLLAREVSYTSVELERSQLTAQPIDVQKINALNIGYQMNTDQMVYISGSPLWINKTPDEILSDVNTLLTAAWQASAYAVCPSELRLPPAQFSYIASQKVSSAGNVSILKFLQDNCISLNINGKALNIQPIKWLVGRGSGGTDRMMVYTNEEDRVRFPMVPIRRETAYYSGIRFVAPYLWAFGEMEIVYSETLRYSDGI
jgi:hypothetical protein